MPALAMPTRGDDAAVFSRALLAALSDFVAAHLGLHFPEQRWCELQRGIAAAASDLGFTGAESCARWLLSANLERKHVEILASHLTIGETYFFREQGSFDALREHIVPELLRRRLAGERKLRIWSAGCCTGEEAYSLAILLDELIPTSERWNLTILATDINPVFLRKAAAGIYGEWSFRGAPPWLRQRYFEQCRNGQWQLHPHIRSRVRFSYLNLADDVYPSLTNSSNAMDVILCRNVLMYFSADRIRKISGNFHRCLVDGGWLIVSPTETSNNLFPGFAPVEFSGSFLYRKFDGIVPPPAPQPISLLSAVGATAPWQTAELAVSPAPPWVDEPQAAIAATPDEIESPGVTARRCANQGRLAEAIEWCETAIVADKLDPAHYYLKASIEQEQGRSEAAMQSLARALYLDPDFVLAHFALGNIELSQGRRQQADRHFTHTLALLRGHADDEQLPEADGLTAGRLAEIVVSLQAGLTASEEGQG